MFTISKKSKKKKNKRDKKVNKEFIINLNLENDNDKWFDETFFSNKYAKAVIFDEGQKMYERYAMDFINNGYYVKVLHLSEMYRSDHYNPFTYFQNDMEICEFAQMFFNNTDMERPEKVLLLETLILYLIKYRPYHQQHWESILKLSLADERPNDILDEMFPSKKTKLDKIFEEVEVLDPKSVVVQNYRALKTMPFRPDLHSVLHKDILRITKDDQMEFSNIKERNVVYFIIYNRNQLNHWLFHIFCQQISKYIEQTDSYRVVNPPEQYKHFFENAIRKVYPMMKDDRFLYNAIPKDELEEEYRKAEEVAQKLKEQEEERNEEKEKEKAPKEQKLSETYVPSKIKEIFDSHIVGQTDAKDILSVAIYKHLLKLDNPDDSIDKTNILLCGPTGCGKTEFARVIAKEFDLPLAVMDATTITETGYKGADATDALKRLLRETNGNLEKAQRGIIYIDEIDKIATTGKNGYRDSYQSGTQQCLLKLIEGGKFDIEMYRGENTLFDTENVLFILGGAFSSLTSETDKEEQKVIGFTKTETSQKIETIRHEDIVKFGLARELVGRIPVIAQLNNLTAEDLVKIAVEPKNSIVNQYKNIFKCVKKINLSFEYDALLEIANSAQEAKIGARGLKYVFEKLMRPLFYKITTDEVSKYADIIITKDFILNEADVKIKNLSKQEIENVDKVFKPDIKQNTEIEENR